MCFAEVVLIIMLVNFHFQSSTSSLGGGFPWSSTHWAQRVTATVLKENSGQVAKTFIWRVSKFSHQFNNIVSSCICRKIGSEHHNTGRERGGGGREYERPTFLCLWCGDIDQRRDGRQHCLLIPTAQTLDAKLHPIIFDEVLHVGWIQAAVTYPSHCILYHFLVHLLGNDIKEQVKDVEFPEVIIVDGIIGKVGQVSQHLQLEFCMIWMSVCVCEREREKESEWVSEWVRVREWGYLACECLETLWRGFVGTGTFPLRGHRSSCLDIAGCWTSFTEDVWRDLDR